NTFRLPAYHRGDLSVIYTMSPRWGESNLTLSIYNVYDRRNPYFLTLVTEYKDINQDGVTIKIPEKISARQVSLFPILPSLTWNFNF
ncbi:MAG TPA: TonB-dependent receptor, partial [Saprospiraceae bacterium]|nr:TonB-dependent receptor [Saprospiraceae bacterium]